MTPEQRAILPDRTPASDAHIEAVNRLISTVRAIRRRRWDLEYPPNHPERHKVPEWMRNGHQ